MHKLGTATFVDSRPFGDAIVSIISEGILPWAPNLQAPEVEWRRAMPEADAEGVVRLGMNLACIQMGGAVIVIDPGFDDPSPRVEGWPGLERTAGLQAGLDQLGIAAARVDHILLTHAHSDHYEGVTVEQDGRRVPRYPNARYWIGRSDWETNPERDRPASSLSLHLGTLARLGLLNLVDEQQDIVPGVTMIAAPGESPGHCIVRLTSAGLTFFYLGDLFHHPCEVSHPNWVSPFRNKAAMMVSRQRLMEDAVASNATLVFAHEQFPGWGRIVQSGEGYRWERD
jgi:glyoxylase-like metal-dependent hydrolase (beta-lactamase superfamily II)